MISRLQSHLFEYFSFLSGKKLLLAVSGGIDSMVLADLFRKLPFEIALAHCNFKLRNDESDEDQNFVESYAKQNHILLFVSQFDTATFASDYKLSIQVAARKLRYNWFYELLESEKYDYLLTAHHADDVIETFLINLSRGTGLDGLTGIPQQNDKIVRPLLPFSRAELTEYADKNKIQWREDSSNASDKYLRNKIRHQMVPVLKEINPNFLDSFQNTLDYLQQSQSMADDAARIVYRKVVTDDENLKIINLAELLQLPNYPAYLYYWLQPFGFSAWQDIYSLVNAESGKNVFSDNYKLSKDRENLILSQLSEEKAREEFRINVDTAEVNFPLNLSFCKVNDISDPSNTTIFVDAEKLQYPLVLRKWHDDDVFQPFGMNGQSKKVGKHLKDEKLSLPKKEKIWVLASGKIIVWIIGVRQDERFKITTTTKNILQIKLFQ
ncbi:MAG: tRNA lysidine(34) synthetase TilS [Flavobacterium sp.]|nr:tRNA lysidine(34) synthetase TilS [Flavobacterium sp.]